MTQESFTFAGFTFPRNVPIWRPLNRAARGARKRGEASPWCFAYRTAPSPLPNDGKGFYMDSDFAPGLRWQWCDKVEGVRIEHQGWFTDSDFQDQTIRGVVFRLPHGRGFLAGWSMGESMASEVGRRIYQCERAAARAADRDAESVAGREREYQDGWRDGQTARELWRDALGDALAQIGNARTMRKAARVALRRALAQREGEAAGFVPPETVAEARALYRQALKRSREMAEAACESRREAYAALSDRPASYRNDSHAEGWREGFAS